MRLVEGHVGGIVALGHGDLMCQVVDAGRLCPVLEGPAIFAIERFEKQRQIVLLHLGVVLDECLDVLLRYALGGLELLLGGVLLQLPVGELRPVRPLKGKAVEGNEHRTASRHETLAPARCLEPLRQIELLEEGTDRARKVLHDLPPIEDLGRGIGLPDHLDRLGREVGDRTRLQQPQLALRDRPLDVLGQAVVEGLDFDRGRGELLQPVFAEGRPLSLVFGNLFDSRAVLSVGDDLLLFGTDHRLFRAEGLSVDDIAVGCDVTADHRFSEAETGFDDQLGALTGRRIGSEENARDLRRHHHLGHDRHRDRSLVDAVLMAIGDRLRGPQR